MARPADRRTRGRAPPLLLLQGQANSHRWWDGLRASFEATFRTITIDYREASTLLGDPSMTPEETAALSGRIPGAHLRVWPRGRHGFFEKFSPEVNPMVLDFLVSQLP